MDITPDTSASEVLWSVPASRSILRDYGVDPDAVDGLTLAQAAAKAGKEVEPLLLSLQRTSGFLNNHRSLPEEIVSGTPEQMKQVLQDLYHSTLRKLLPEFGSKLAMILAARGEDYPELYDVGRLFERYRRAVEEHAQEESTAIFPVLTSGEPIDESRMRTAVDHLKEGREKIAGLARDIRNLTLAFPLSRSNDPAVKALYETWRQADSLVSRALALEENWLLPLAHGGAG